MQIIPIRDLKDTVKIESLCAEEQGPVFITKNGYGRLVVMDIDYYQKTMQKIFEANAIKSALKDVENGVLFDGNKTLSELENKYGTEI